MDKNMRLTVLLSAPYMIPIFKEFKGYFDEANIEVIVADVEERLSEADLFKFAGEIDGVICGDDAFSRDVLEALSPRLKVLSKWGTGIDSIDQDASKDLGVQVFNTPGAFTDPVADTVLEYMLMFARKGPWQDRVLKAGKWIKIPSRSLNECTLGVVGVGTIGKAVLRRAKAFGMHLLGNDIVEISPDFTSEVGVEMHPLPNLLAASDFISINCDLNPTSHQLINREMLSHFKPSAVLINTARGKIVDENALIEFLKDGKLAGAALDVFEQEPLPSDSPLLGMDHVLLAAHNSNSSPKAWQRVHLNTIRNLFKGFGLEVPFHEG
jgi:D-3-phosphoglycerate dehydrogenase